MLQTKYKEGRWTFGVKKQPEKGTDDESLHLLSVAVLICATAPVQCLTELLNKLNALKSIGLCHPHTPQFFILNFVLSIPHSTKDLGTSYKPLWGGCFRFQRSPICADRWWKMSAGGTLEKQRFHSLWACFVSVPLSPRAPRRSLKRWAVNSGAWGQSYFW